MRARAGCGWPLALLFLASALPSDAQKAAASGERLVTVALGAPLTVECEVRAEQRAEWRVDGRAVAPDLAAAGEAERGGALAVRLHAARARAHHAGLYTCEPAQGHRVRVRVLPAGTTEAAAAAVEAAGAGAAVGVVDAIPVVYEVRGNLSLSCAGLADDPTTEILWSVNGTRLDALGEGARKRLRVAGATLSVEGRANEDDFGNYSCSAGGRERAWRVEARTRAVLPANTNVVEGQKLKLTCKLVGKPYPRVLWTYSNTSEAVGNGSLEVTLALGERAALRESAQGVAGAELVLEPAQRSDAGWLRCSPVDERGAPAGVPAVSTLRVKDMYAALWPFLGICAEVFVLCAIILVYEKRRTKPELDDSDTDNHDQKKS